MLYQYSGTGQKPYPERGANTCLTSSTYLPCVFFQVADDPNLCGNLPAAFPNLLGSINSWAKYCKKRYVAVRDVLLAPSGFITQRFGTVSTSTTEDPCTMSCTCAPATASTRPSPQHSLENKCIKMFLLFWNTFWHWLWKIDAPGSILLHSWEICLLAWVYLIWSEFLRTRVTDT